jgi:membrane fusion protein (multidrug efflux system)
MAAALMVVACGKKKASFSPPPPEVSVLEVRPGTVAQTFEFAAQVVPYRRIEVRARVEGVIEERAFSEGAVVKPGDLLFRLDKVRYEAAYRGALARHENAKSTFDRLEPLVAEHAVSQLDVDNARSALAAADAALTQAKKDLDDTEVRAEIEGRVGRALLEVGARVTGPADLLTTIDKLDPVYVSFRPSSDELLDWHGNARAQALVRPGSPLVVEALLPDGSLVPRTGRLEFVAPSLDAATGTEEFRAVFANGDRLLMPGQFVHVRLVGFAQDSALAVPLRAVLSGLGGQFVYVVGAGDTAVSRDVHPGPWSGKLWIIDKGLNAGDRVVVDGVQKVIPGHPVHPVPFADTSAAR